MDLYLTPASISFLAQTILFLGVTIYLVLLSTHTKANYWLSGFFTVLVAASLAGFVGVSSLNWYDKAIFIHYSLLLVALPLLIQFAYNFPDANPSRKTEARTMLVFSILIMIFAILVTVVYVFELPVIEISSIIPLLIKIFGLLELAWVSILLIDMTTQVALNAPGVSWIKRFVKPQGRAAHATQGFSLTLGAMLLFWIGSLVLEILGNQATSFFLLTLSTSWCLSIFIFVLINQTNRKASLLIKLIGIIMLTAFTGINAAAWLAAPVSTANYQASFAIPNRQTLFFNQNNAVYTITQHEFNFDTQLGNKLEFNDGEIFTPIDLVSTFPFAGENWQQIQVSQKGFILFGEPNSNKHFSMQQNSLPLIASLYIENLQPSEFGGVFANVTEDKVVITWYLIALQDNPEDSITTQVVMTPDGSFNITYNGIRTNFNYNPYLPEFLDQITGFFLGDNDKNPIRIQFNKVLPFTSQEWSGVYQDYYIDFRDYLHLNMVMLLYAMLFATMVMLIIFPIFFQNSLVKPLNILRSGISQVAKGDLQSWLEPYHNDDFGKATMEFNQMMDTLHSRQGNRRETIRALEDRLKQRNKELSQSVEILSKEIEIRKRLSQQLDKCLQKTRKLAITDDLVGCYNRAHMLHLLEEETKRAKRYELPLSFMIIDPDYLRMINETYGTMTGDEVLKGLGQVIQNNLRETDYFGRFGGEEFAIIMPQTNGKEGMLAANRIRNLIGGTTLETSKGIIRLSISMGIVEMPAEAVISIDLLIRRANQALDQAKMKGRNKAYLWDSSMEKEEN